MPSQETTQFNKEIALILQNLKPHSRSCRGCNTEFQIHKEDVDFYRIFKVPAPTLCFFCRLQNRFGYRINILPIFYKRTCNAPGHNEKIISFYSDANKNLKIYDYDYYWSDKWDGLDFGRTYDFSHDFFSQFNELALQTPHQSLHRDPKSVDCDYVVSGLSSKNCYYCSAPLHSENVYYSRVPFHSRDCLDTDDALHSEWCYQCILIERCYNCNFCIQCSNCLDSWFLFDCRNCQNCFGCMNLRNKKYCFFNEQLTKEEYQNKLNVLNLGDRESLKEQQKKIGIFITEKALRKNLNNVKTVNCLGDELKECRNCFYSFQNWNRCENGRYNVYVSRGRDLMDVFGSSDSDLVYYSTGISYGSNIKFCVFLRIGLNLEYCVECRDCENCFGCFGLRDKKFCIFNKQYSEADYLQLVDKIKVQMLKAGEYGEFFPLQFSPCPYNDSSASVEFPLSKEKILSRGWHWQDEVKSEIDLSKFKVIQARELPQEISGITDDILDKVIICEETGKPFRITKYELDFYRRRNLPLPTIHPLERIKKRIQKRQPYRLWQYPCAKCGSLIWSSYNPEKKLKVLCEFCYNKEVV